MKKKKDKGIDIGESIHINSKSKSSVVKIINYSSSSFSEKTVTGFNNIFPLKKNSGITWINVIGTPTHAALNKIGKKFKIHHLTQEDIANTNQRPKIENYDDYLFLILKMMYYDEEKNEVSTEQISIVLGTNFVLSFQEKRGDVFESIIERIKNKQGRLRRMRPDYLLYTLTDIIVDNYAVVLEKVEDLLGETETEVLEHPTPKTMNRIHKLEREILFLRKSVWPLREVLSNLQRLETKFVKANTRIYFNDVSDHTLQVNDTIETFSSMVAGMLDMYLSSVNNRMNEIMTVLTVIGTIFIPLTFITGVYGMNFRFMPELYWRYGYLVILLIMFGLGLTMYFVFKHKKWI